MLVKTTWYRRPAATRAGRLKRTRGQNPWASGFSAAVASGLPRGTCRRPPESLWMATRRVPPVPPL